MWVKDVVLSCGHGLYLEGYGDQMRVSQPRRAIVGDHEAYLWSVEIDGVPHDVAWWVADGSIRLSFPVDATRPSRFVTLGPSYSPCYSLRAAMRAVDSWAKVRQERVAS
jgi:hypothetical protein